MIETEELESDCGNNSEFVYLYPDYDITLIAGTGGNVSGGGTYVKGDDAILIATPSSGYILMDGMKTENDYMGFLTNAKLPSIQTGLSKLALRKMICKLQMLRFLARFRPEKPFHSL